MSKLVYILPFLLLGLIILIPCCEVFAQCGPGPAGTENGNPCCAFAFPGCSCPVCTPIPLDGGLSALLIAGVAYGAKRVYGKKS